MRTRKTAFYDRYGDTYLVFVNMANYDTASHSWPTFRVPFDSKLRSITRIQNRSVGPEDMNATGSWQVSTNYGVNWQNILGTDVIPSRANDYIEAYASTMYAADYDNLVYCSAGTRFRFNCLTAAANTACRSSLTNFIIAFQEDGKPQESYPMSVQEPSALKAVREERTFPQKIKDIWRKIWAS